MAVSTSNGLQEVLTRGVTSFVDQDGVFSRKIESAPEKCVIKLGADPTRPDIHLGHAVILRKLRQFQDLGAKVVFVVGDYTAAIGDPSGRSRVRPEVGFAEIERNMQTYIEQVGKILLTSEAHFAWIRNSDWYMGPTDLEFPPGTRAAVEINAGGERRTVELDPNSLIGKTALYESTRMQRNVFRKKDIVAVTLRGFLWTVRHITHARLIERDMFEGRIKRGEELYMHELIYPVLQGIDSYVLSEIFGSCDLEIGGSDQTFNMLLGRDVMKANSRPPQAVLACELLVGTDGKEKMSKSLGNYIGIAEPAASIYGKIMSIPDSAIGDYFRLAAYTPLSEVEKIEASLSSGGQSARDIKMLLAREISEIYHGQAAAKEAERDFVNTFAKGGVPEGIKEVKVPSGTLLSELALAESLVPSKSEFRRLVRQGAVSMVESKEKISDPLYALKSDGTVRIGATRFIKVKVASSK
ncbi:MAG: tyrosine--tRNA ligase [Candidatus Taylorbacteria bacterium]|nr:tyrosine--tRNA ligase [Candidatus Taylorbacteria bacterium]